MCMDDRWEQTNDLFFQLDIVFSAVRIIALPISSVLLTLKSKLVHSSTISSKKREKLTPYFLQDFHTFQ